MHAAAVALVVLHLVKVGHFATPVYATATPADPGAIYVVEQAGRVRRLARGRVSTFLDLRGLVKDGDDQGLLSIAFDPDYARTHAVYLDYTARNGDEIVARYVPRMLTTLMHVRDVASDHNGGQLQFGPDGDLYWSNGDGGGEGDPFNLGQNLTRPFARIMKLNVHRRGARWQLVAYGLRDPWRFSFDAAGGLFVGDVGQDRWEEVDYLPPGFRGVANFGWPHWEGNHLFRPKVPLATRGTYLNPVAEYGHDLGCVVIGGYVWRGRYTFGDACSGAIFSLVLRKGRATDIRREPYRVPGLSSFGVDGRGNLYAMSSVTGNLFRVG